MFSIGKKLTTAYGQKLEIVGGPWSGGQGSVYRVRSESGESFALKWYHDSYYENKRKSKELWDSLSKIMGKSVGEEFAWPLEFVNENLRFGYIMEFVNFEKYLSLDDIQRGEKKTQPSLQTQILISLNICVAFAKLHAEGFCYRDINDGNIMMDIKTGKIKIVDNDNVGIENYSTSDVRGVPDFMAPEVLRDFKNVTPSKYTDYHSLAIYLFKLWMWHHPFEGKNLLETRILDRNAKVRYFGKEPKFIFNDDNSNPLPEIVDEGTKDEADYKYVHRFWKACYPKLQQLFKKMFVEGVADPAKRPLETVWVKVFREMYDAVLVCPSCQAENLLTEHETCWHCKRKYPLPIALTVQKKYSPISMSLLVTLGKQVRTCHFNSKEEITEGKTVATFIPHPSDSKRLVLRNDTTKKWFFMNSKQEIQDVAPGRGVIVDPNNEIDFGNGYVGTFEQH